MRHFGILLFATVFLAAFTLPLSGQQGGGRPGGGGRSSTSAPPSMERPQQGQRIQSLEQRVPGIDSRVFVITGRVQSGSGYLGEQIRVEFWNHGQMLRAVFSDLRGNFSFTFDRSSAALVTAAGNSATTSDASHSGAQNRYRQGGFGFGSQEDVRNMIQGGEIRVYVAGFHPVSKSIISRLSMITNVGAITLKRLANVEGTAVSLTSFQAPKKARKELNKAVKLLKKSKTQEAAEHLQKAVEVYPQYAVVWHMLGKIYLNQNQPEKAHQAFSESIKADPKYIRPYLEQANIQMLSRQFTDLIETSGTLLRLDPTLGTASYYKAVGHYYLGQFAEGEKSALTAVQSPGSLPPGAHFMLGSLLAHEGTYAEAAKELRLFLQIAAGSPAAVEAQKLLTEMEGHLSRTQQTETAPQ